MCTGMLLLAWPSIAFTDQTEATVTAETAIPSEATATAQASDRASSGKHGSSGKHDSSDKHDRHVDSCSNDLDCQLNGECIEQAR